MSLSNVLKNRKAALLKVQRDRITEHKKERNLIAWIKDLERRITKLEHK